MGQAIKKVTLRFDVAADGDPAQASMTTGALALTSAEDSGAVAATRAAEYALAWGITIPADFMPATKAQVAYWRELCGVISLAGTAGMRDGSWPAELAPSKPTLQGMAERKLIVRRRRGWHLKRKWHAWLHYLRLTAIPTPCPSHTAIAVARKLQDEVFNRIV